MISNKKMEEIMFEHCAWTDPSQSLYCNKTPEGIHSSGYIFRAIKQAIKEEHKALADYYDQMDKNHYLPGIDYKSIANQLRNFDYDD